MLLTSPLDQDGHKKIRVWKKIYLGVLNPIDLIISKMFRGTDVDLKDCLTLFRNERVDLKKLEARYRKTAKYEVSEERVLRNLDLLREQLK